MALLNDQAYRLAFWRVAAEEINYRRFFDINDLAAIRMEVPEVFDEVHRLLFELIASGAVTGLRIDHPDDFICLTNTSTSSRLAPRKPWREELARILDLQKQVPPLCLTISVRSTRGRENPERQ
jgi:hypothetical protein